MINYTEIARQAAIAVDYQELGLTYQDYLLNKSINEMGALLGSDWKRKQRKQIDSARYNENIQLSYDFDGFEVYHKRYYHEDCKIWLDTIENIDMPVQISSITTSYKTADIDGRKTTKNIRIWRFKDIETNLNLDFELYDKTKEEDNDATEFNNVAHVKFIWAEPQYQQGYFITVKSLNRFAKILFNTGTDYLEGWAARINHLPVKYRNRKEWRDKKVLMKDNKRKLSKNNGIALLAFWLRCGWIITGNKKNDSLISFVSPKMYYKCLEEDNNMWGDSFKYARNLPYEI